MADHDSNNMSEREANLLRSLTTTTWKFYCWVGFLLSVALWGLFAYITQLRQGLVVTGMRDQISWGLYITDFVFFIGISHAGTLISAILRVAHAGWRRPITRLAEGITVFAICIGAPMVIIDLGRPERMWNLIRHGRIQSTILWDLISVSTYLTGCLLYFFIPMIPDMAMLAKRPELPAWRRKLYKLLSFSWRGNKEQWHILEKIIGIMAIFIIPLAVSVHTVVSWMFAMTLRPGWNTTIFGPYFVIGAIYSGIGAVIISMYCLRRIFKLDNYLEPIHFRNLGILLLAMSLLFLYCNVNEYMVIGYKIPGEDKNLLNHLFVGDFAPYFKAMIGLTCFLPPLLLIAVLGVKRWRIFTVPGTVLASSFVVIGAWMERFLIIVPTLSSPFLPAPQRLPNSWTHYSPTWIEWSVTAAAFAMFMLIYTLLSKLFPMVSIWETRVKEEPAMETTEERVERVVPAMRPQPYMPPPLSVLLIGAILVGAISARAQDTPAAKTGTKPTSLSLEWEPVQSDETASPTAEGDAKASGSKRVYYFAVQALSPLFWSGKPSTGEEDKPRVRPLAISAKLRDASGAPLAYQAVGFALQTSFGTLLPLGKVPTDGDGKAKLVVRDRRCGSYPFQAVYGGDQTNKISFAEARVDFGACPAPSLPSAGVLITPYKTAPITMAFTFFYGTMWVVFAYSVGYLLLYKLRRAGAAEESDYRLTGGRSL